MMEVQRAEELARAMLEIGLFSARVERDSLVAPIADHLTSLPDGDDHVVTPRVSGAALLLVTQTALLDTEFREHGKEIRTLGYRLDDPSLVIALDSEADEAKGGRQTVWHFRFHGGQVEIAGHTDSGECDEREAFARRLAAMASR